MNIQRKNSAHHFRMQSEREQTLVTFPVFFFPPTSILQIHQICKMKYHLKVHLNAIRWYKNFGLQSGSKDMKCSHLTDNHTLSVTL